MKKKSYPPKSKAEKQRLYPNRIKNSSEAKILYGNQKCLECGLYTVIYKNGICWECYKESINARFN